MELRDVIAAKRVARHKKRRARLEQKLTRRTRGLQRQLNNAAFEVLHLRQVISEQAKKIKQLLEGGTDAGKTQPAAESQPQA
jgi:hypothetical protein